MEARMTRFAALTTVVAVFVLIVNITPSWGQTPVCVAPGCNPTTSDHTRNTAGGQNALGSVISGLGVCGAGVGCDNSAFGEAALFSTTTGSDNTAIGYHAMNQNDIGFENTASGASALAGNTQGAGNTASGAFALFTNSTGNDNTASGAGALEFNVTGSNNTATGASALVSNTDGSGNTSAGSLALQFNVNGSNNTALGFKALKKSLGTKNIGIGYQAGVTLTNGSNNILIGNQGKGDESQTIRVGTAQTSTYIAGINSAGVGGTAVLVDADGRLGVTLSSARYKQDIEAMASRSEGLLKLRPVTFSYKDDSAAAPHYGLIAEEVATVSPDLVTSDREGKPTTVRYEAINAMLLNEFLKEHRKVETLEATVARLAATVEEQASQIQVMNAELELSKPALTTVVNNQ